MKNEGEGGDSYCTWQAGKKGGMQMEHRSEQPMTEGCVASVTSILQALLGSLPVMKLNVIVRSVSNSLPQHYQRSHAGIRRHPYVAHSQAQPFQSLCDQMPAPVLQCTLNS